MRFLTLAIVVTFSCRKSEAPAPMTVADPPSAEAPKGVVALDLTAKGLPVALDVPVCAKVETPAVKVAGNQHDLILACEGGLDAPAFALQVGIAKGKTWKKEMEADPEFKKWIQSEPNFLLREVTSFSSTAKDFAYRTKLNGVEYMCFSQFATNDEALLKQMIAACRSLRVP
jgi:hypothetical protein